MKERKAITNRNLRLSRYGLSVEAFKVLLQTQNGKCAICKEVPIRPCVDHCHITGRVRGILCRACNLGIGNLRDSIGLLKSAIDYLKGI